jgi:hypothetical protein
MFLFADDMGHSLSGFKDRAFKRVAEISLRYAREIYNTKDILLSTAYLQISRAIDPAIIENVDYKDLVIAMNNSASISSNYWSRSHSYKVPDGSKILGDKN